MDDIYVALVEDAVDVQVSEELSKQFINLEKRVTELERNQGGYAPPEKEN